MSLSNIAVIIPFYNEIEFLEKAIESLLKSNYPLQQIIVVDNSTKNIDLISIQDRSTIIQIIRTQPAIGFGRANNIGTYNAIQQGADFVLILNQDAIVEKNAIELLLTAFQNPKIGIATPLITEYENHTVHPLFQKMYLSQLPQPIDYQTPYHLLPKAMSGACMLIKVAYINELGLFSPLIYMYGEDVDVYERFKKHGYQSAIVLQAIVKHAHSHAQATDKKLAQIKAYTFAHTPIGLLTNEKNLFLALFYKIPAFQFRAIATAIYHLQFKLVLRYWIALFQFLISIPKILPYRNIHYLKQQIQDYIQKDTSF